MNLFDRYQMTFDVKAELEDINSMHSVVATPFMKRENYRFTVESKLGGLFEMRNYPDDFGKVATFVQGEHRKSVLHDMIEEANHAHKMAGKLEQYGDHLADCEMKIDNFVPDYDEDEPHCTCGFASALMLDETFQNLVRSPKVVNPKW